MGKGDFGVLMTGIVLPLLVLIGVIAIIIASGLWKVLLVIAGVILLFIILALILGGADKLR